MRGRVGGCVRITLMLTNQFFVCIFMCKGVHYVHRKELLDFVSY